MAVMISRSITKPINRVAEGLTDGANQVASAAGQVSSASQSFNNKLLCIGTIIAITFVKAKNEYLKKQKGAMDRRRSEE
jgi:hypothetical protein